MKIKFALLVVVLTASVVCFCGTADSEGNVGGTKNSVGNGTVNEIVDHTKKDEGGDLDKNESKEKLVSKGGENGQKKEEIKENDGSDSGLGKEANGASLVPLIEKCDSSSNRCTDDDKTFVACLRVPGNESPALSLLIQNMGKGSLSINISAPDLVQLEKNQIELEEKKDTEVKVSITGIENGHIIILTAGHGNCSLNIRDQLLGKNKIDHSNEPPKPNIFNPTLSTAFLLIVAALLIVALSVFVCTKLESSQVRSRAGMTAGMTAGTMKKHRRHLHYLSLRAFLPKVWLRESLVRKAGKISCRLRKDYCEVKWLLNSYILI
ncbi:hypothetical protein ABFS82_01G063000 [Erythranthe guttata]